MLVAKTERFAIRSVSPSLANPFPIGISHCALAHAQSLYPFCSCPLPRSFYAYIRVSCIKRKDSWCV